MNLDNNCQGFQLKLENYQVLGKLLTFLVISVYLFIFTIECTTIYIIYIIQTNIEHEYSYFIVQHSLRGFISWQDKKEIKYKGVNI